MAEGVVESKEEKKKLEKKKEEKDVIKIQPKHIETPPQADEHDGHHHQHPIPSYGHRIDGEGNGVNPDDDG